MSTFRQRNTAAFEKHAVDSLNKMDKVIRVQHEIWGMRTSDEIRRAVCTIMFTIGFTIDKLRSENPNRGRLAMEYYFNQVPMESNLIKLAFKKARIRRTDSVEIQDSIKDTKKRMGKFKDGMYMLNECLEEFIQMEKY